MQFLPFTAFVEINETSVLSVSIDSLTKGILYGLGLLKSWSGTVVTLGTLIAGEFLLLCLYNRHHQQQQ